MPAHTHTGQVGAGDQGLDVVSVNTASSRLALTPVDQSWEQVRHVTVLVLGHHIVNHSNTGVWGWDDDVLVTSGGVLTSVLTCDHVTWVMTWDRRPGVETAARPVTTHTVTLLRRHWNIGLRWYNQMCWYLLEIFPLKHYNCWADNPDRRMRYKTEAENIMLSMKYCLEWTNKGKIIVLQHCNEEVWVKLKRFKIWCSNTWMCSSILKLTSRHQSDEVQKM